MLLVLRLYFDTITVHAPQPPSAHPNFVPVKRTEWQVKLFAIDKD